MKTHFSHYKICGGMEYAPTSPDQFVRSMYARYDTLLPESRSLLRALFLNRATVESERF